MGIFRVWGTIIVAVWCVLPFAATAQNVVLTAKNGVLTVEGKLLSFDGEIYKVETKLGPVTVEAETVECAGEGCPKVTASGPKFDVVGDVQLSQALLEAFAATQDAQIEVEVQSASQQAVLVRSRLGAVLAEIALTAPKGASPYDAVRKGGTVVLTTVAAPKGVETRIIGYDGVVIATSDVNPVHDISLARMRAVLAGDITNWKELGGGDVPVNLHVAQGDAGFEAQVAAAKLAPVAGVVSIPHGRMKDAADAVANDPYGLAVVPFSVLRTARAMGLQGSCGMHNDADVFNLKSNTYPMIFPLFAAASKSGLEGFAQDFVAFLGTAQAQAVISDIGFADTGIEEKSLDQQGQRLANSLITIGREVPLKDVREMAVQMSGAQRLSVTFRFKAKSMDLDAQSLQAARSFVSALMLGNYADKVVYLMGFSDGDGRAVQNKTLSGKQAEAVLVALSTMAPAQELQAMDFRLEGYGEASPLVCEESEQDKYINRRVEVWVKDP